MGSAAAVFMQGASNRKQPLSAEFLWGDLEPLGVADGSLIRPDCEVYGLVRGMSFGRPSDQSLGLENVREISLPLRAPEAVLCHVVPAGRA